VKPERKTYFSPPPRLLVFVELEEELLPLERLFVEELLDDEPEELAGRLLVEEPLLLGRELVELGLEELPDELEGRLLPLLLLGGL